MDTYDSQDFSNVSDSFNVTFDTVSEEQALEEPERNALTDEAEQVKKMAECVKDINSHLLEALNNLQVMFGPIEEADRLVGQWIDTFSHANNYQDLMLSERKRPVNTFFDQENVNVQSPYDYEKENLMSQLQSQGSEKDIYQEQFEVSEIIEPKKNRKVNSKIPSTKSRPTTATQRSSYRARK